MVLAQRILSMRITSGDMSGNSLFVFLSLFCGREGGVYEVQGRCGGYSATGSGLES